MILYVWNLRCFAVRKLLSQIYALLSVKFSDLKSVSVKKVTNIRYDYTFNLFLYKIVINCLKKNSLIALFRPTPKWKIWISWIFFQIQTEFELYCICVFFPIVFVYYRIKIIWFFGGSRNNFKGFRPNQAYRSFKALTLRHGSTKVKIAVARRA